MFILIDTIIRFLWPFLIFKDWVYFETNARFEFIIFDFSNLARTFATRTKNPSQRGVHFMVVKVRTKSKIHLLVRNEVA